MATRWRWETNQLIILQRLRCGLIWFYQIFAYCMFLVLFAAISGSKCSKLCTEGLPSCISAPWQSQPIRVHMAASWRWELPLGSWKKLSTCIVAHKPQHGTSDTSLQLQVWHIGQRHPMFRMPRLVVWMLASYCKFVAWAPFWGCELDKWLKQWGHLQGTPLLSAQDVAWMNRITMNHWVESSGDILDDWDRGRVCDEQRAKLLLEPSWEDWSRSCDVLCICHRFVYLHTPGGQKTARIALQLVWWLNLRMLNRHCGHPFLLCPLFFFSLSIWSMPLLLVAAWLCWGSIPSSLENFHVGSSVAFHRRSPGRAGFVFWWVYFRRGSSESSK